MTQNEESEAPERVFLMDFTFTVKHNSSSYSIDLMFYYNLLVVLSWFLVSFLDPYEASLDKVTFREHNT